MVQLVKRPLVFVSMTLHLCVGSHPGTATKDFRSGHNKVIGVGIPGCVSQPANVFAKANEHYRLSTHNTKPEQHYFTQTSLKYSSLRELTGRMEEGYGGI